VEGWQIPAGLLSKVAKSKTSLRYSVSLTFYHAHSKRFFGSTLMGQQVEGLPMKDLLKRTEETNAAMPAAASPANVVINVTHDEILYWYSRLVDQVRQSCWPGEHCSAERLGSNQGVCAWSCVRTAWRCWSSWRVRSTPTTA
jgi:hypothetical protein